MLSIVNSIVSTLPYEEADRSSGLEKVVGGVDTERRHRPDIAPAPTPSGHAGSEDVVMSGAIDENVTPAKPPSGKAVEKLGSKEDKQQPVPETEKDSPFYTGSSIFEESRPKRNLKGTGAPLPIPIVAALTHVSRGGGEGQDSTEESPKLVSIPVVRVTHADS